jgi:DNA topoisomerase-1
MGKTLVIVESPGKIKKIQNYLGSSYLVKASVGHIMDLDPMSMSIDIVKQDNNKYIFVPNYIVNKDKKKVVNSLKEAVKDSTDIILAADEDREGEFIAFSLEKQLKLKKPKRIVFNAITKEALQHALLNPKTIDMDLVHAQQARRLLDRIVGYGISPLLGSNLSAGRVQSVVVKLIIEKEEEIKHELENMRSCFITCGQFELTKFEAKLYPNYYEKPSHAELINLITINPYYVSDIETKKVNKNPFPPFITSTLQQEASSKLKIGASTTMQLAQKLYEKGNITYMRTDSTSINKEASASILKFVKDTYGSEYYKYRTYKNKESAQEAHECIRPTYITNVTIDDATPDEKRLYDLIWKRTVASQMEAAIFDCQIVTIKNKDKSFKDKYFKTTNKKLAFDGFLKVYNVEENDKDEVFIDINKNDNINLTSLTSKQEYDYTNSRYSEASLIKKLEHLGIGRPSTYVSILETIQKRNYVQIANIDGVEKDSIEISIDKNKKVKEKVKKIKIGTDKKKYTPTDIGLNVTKFLQEHFPTLLDYGYTSGLEKQLDIVAEGKMNYQEVLNNIYALIKPKMEKLRSELASSSSSSNAKSLGTDNEGTSYSVIHSKNGWVIKKDFKNTKSSLFFGIDESEKNMSLEEAIRQSESGKLLGTYRGKPVFVMVGKFGPYLKYGTKNINLKGNADITFEIAKKLL